MERVQCSISGTTPLLLNKFTDAAAQQATTGNRVASVGEFMGPRIARKHASWYLQTVPDSELFRKEFNKLETAQAQQDSVHRFFEQLIKKEEKAA
jgi:tRNA-dihydrouridine synthase